MRLRSLLSRLVLLAGTLLLACAAPRGVPGEALRALFPGQAARVLSAPRRFTPRDAGFSAHVRDDVGADLPERGEGALRFSLGPGFAVRVREVGATGRAASADRAIAYPRSGGTSFWAAEDDGYEEWLSLEAGAVRRDAPVAAWEVEGAVLREHGDAVEVVDARGEARLAITAPEAYAASGRPVAARLAARGARLELWVDAEGEAVLVDPAWKRTRSARQGRAEHTATLLPDGRVLVVGGLDGNRVMCWPPPSLLGDGALGCPLGTVEAYDPKTQRWTSMASMITPRAGHTATLLPDGRVLVTGGLGLDAPLATAEIYDPAHDTWTAVQAPMSVARAYHTATLLPDGRVLIAGGSTSRSAELYDPSTGAWIPAGKMKVATVGGRTATVLHDGRILFIGGITHASSPRDGTPVAEVYTPAKGTWAAVARMPAGRADHTATLLPNGVVLVAGGEAGPSGSDSAETFDPSHNVWTPIFPMSAVRSSHTATLLDSGLVLVAGGSAAPPELYDYSDKLWIPGVAMNEPRSAHTATLLHDGTVLVVGGGGSPSLATAELYSESERQWRTVHPMSSQRVRHTATLLQDGRVLVAGGTLQVGVAPTGLSSSALYDPTRGTWTDAGEMADARAQHSATVLQDGTVLVAGGINLLGQGMAKAEIYHPRDQAHQDDPDAGTWTPVMPMNFPRYGHTATLLREGQVLVAGGWPNASTEVYAPSVHRWVFAHPMSVPRLFCAATLLADGRVLVTGGQTSDIAFLASAELYDSTNGTWSPAHPMISGRAAHAATRLPDGTVLVVGGSGTENAELTSAEIYDPIGDIWSSAPSMNVGREFPLAAQLDDGHVLVFGGSAGDNRAEVYDPAGKTWTLVASTSAPRIYAAAAPVGNNRVLLTGGFGKPPPLGVESSAELFQPQPAGSVCSLPLECLSGVCANGICCGGPCGGGCVSCSIADGAAFDGACELLAACGAYACDTANLACLSKCTTSSECAPGYACAVSHDCVPPTSEYIDDACALATTGGPLRPHPIEPAMALLAALGVLRRRRRARLR